MIALADVAVTVSNAERTARWWVENLGFAVHTIPGSGHAMLVAPPGDRFVLHLCEGFEPVEPGNSGIAFVTDDFDGCVRRLQAAGVPFPEPPTRVAWGGSAKFADPDGNVFWLMEAPTAFIRAERARKAPGSERSTPKGRRAAQPRARSRPRARAVRRLNAGSQ